LTVREYTDYVFVVDEVHVRMKAIQFAVSVSSGMFTFDV
jgi:hypothetical protein